MTPLPIIANTFRVAFDWSVDGSDQIAENVMHFFAPATTAEEVADAIQSAVTGDMWLSAVSTAAIDTLHVTPLDGSSATYIYSTTGDNFVGSAEGDYSPASAVVVAFQTSKRGRSYRGRAYIPFTAEGAISDGSLGGSTASDMQNAWQSFVDGLTSPVVSVVASYKHSTVQDITTCSVANAIGTQRRRQTRVRYP